MSYDPVADNRAFAAKYGFGFRLLSDEAHAMGVAYGASPDLAERWPERISYLIDPTGHVARVYPTVDVRAHAAQVLADLDALGAAG